MASGMGTDDPPPIPPPDFRPQSTADFAKQQMPPLRGLMVDPKYPPTAAEAAKAFKDSQTPPPLSGQDAQGTDPRRSSGASKIFGQAPTSKEVINTMPGGTRHTAGGEEIVDASLASELQKVQIDDFKTVHKIPCVREAGLQGMTFGFLVGGALFILGKPAWRAMNYAVWGSVGTGIAGYEYCQYQRKQEKAGMRVAVKIIEEKKEEKRKANEERRERYRLQLEEKLKAAEVESRRVEENRNRWWRFWRDGKGREG